MSWIWKTIVSDNKYVFSNCGKYIVLWAGEISFATCFYPHSPKIRLWKDKYSWWHCQKISWTQTDTPPPLPPSYLHMYFMVNLNIRFFKILDLRCLRLIYTIYDFSVYPLHKCGGYTKKIIMPFIQHHITLCLQRLPKQLYLTLLALHAVTLWK